MKTVVIHGSLNHLILFVGWWSISVIWGMCLASVGSRLVAINLDARGIYSERKKLVLGK